MTPQEMHEARERGRAIRDLREHWEPSYEIGWAAGQFVAIRTDNGATVRKAKSWELHDALVEDFTARPVALPRL
jgi:hypothetical protein